LFENISNSFEKLKNDPSSTNKKLLSNNLELLLALLRLREKDKTFLHPDDQTTKEFIKLISQITEYVVKNEIEFFSKIELSLSNETDKKIPKLLYALNIYLRGDLNMAQSIKITGVNE
jgi:ribosomal protein L30/L7E